MTARFASLALAAALLFGCALRDRAPSPDTFAEKAPAPEPCPKGPPEGTTCLRGTDSKGAHYLIAMPKTWNGVLVLHTHGGPSIQPRRDRVDEDTERWAITVKAGYAWAASNFHQAGVAVASAAEDTERVRQIFVAHVAKPRRTLVHGNSWGASVALKMGEMYAPPGRSTPYDALVLTNGVVAGGTRAYDFRLDLRVVYQHLCANLPRADEPQYPLWMGSGEKAPSRQEVTRRVEECLGTAKQRTPEQARKLKTITDVIRIDDDQVVSHLYWPIENFRIIAARHGGNAFGNDGVRYRGSADDDALNAAVARYRRDPVAVASFARDADPTGRIGIPVLSVHSVRDPTAMVEYEHVLRDTMQGAGSGERLVQVFTAHRAHSYISHAVNVAAFDAALQWADKGVKPTPASFAERCRALEATHGPGCESLPDYVVKPLASRVVPR